MNRLRLLLTVVAIAFSTLISKADVRVADIFSDHMVLQRNINLKVWGTADPGEKLYVSFNGQKRITKANKKGEWSVVFKPMKAEGAPLNMTIRGNNEIVLKNILIGDVWICSGQSNMQMKVSESNNAEKEIEKANYPNIRLFNVPKTVSNVPMESMPNASWKICTPETIKDFSAVGYFFGSGLQKEIDVPIGLIHTSWGATCVETWTSKASITKLPKYEDFGERIDNYDVTTVAQKYEDDLKKALGGFPEKEMGMEEKWMLPSSDKSAWKSMKLPTLWENAGYRRLNGRVWFSFNFNLNAQELDSLSNLHLGKIHDSDITWVNGIPTTTPERTICDLGLIFPGKEISRILRHAIATGQVNRYDLFRMRYRNGKQGRNGVGILGAALELLPDNAERAESGPEVLFMELCERFGIPGLVPQFPIMVDGKMYRLDFAFPDRRVFVEIDGVDAHSALSQIANDDGRQNALVAAGWQPVRFTSPDMQRKPALCAHTLGQLLDL